MKNWRNLLHHLEGYCRGCSPSFSQIDRKWVQGFKSYLDSVHSKSGKPIGTATKKCYYITFKACVHKALRDGILLSDPTLGVEGYKPQDAKRMYLTLEELRRLAATPCHDSTVRSAFLFSCLTGLRFSDVSRLCWRDVQQQGDFTRLVFRQKKTRSQEYLDIAPQAVALMGERRTDADPVFRSLMDNTSVNRHIAQWVSDAGIGKRITFHCARHTFATMMIELGTDLYTVSKLLGHSDISTTQIYAKILDKTKQKAVSAIPEIIG